MASTTQILGYSKMSAYQSRIVIKHDLYGFRVVRNTVFLKSYSTAEENRKHGDRTSCGVMVVP